MYNERRQKTGENPVLYRDPKGSLKHGPESLWVGVSLCFPSLSSHLRGLFTKVAPTEEVDSWVKQRSVLVNYGVSCEIKSIKQVQADLQITANTLYNEREVQDL